MTASEQATINFYQWEYRYRGYYHFDIPVDIEVPYLPFQHKTISNSPINDDGRIPSFFKQAIKLLSPPREKEEVTEQDLEIQPQFLAFDDKPKLVGISISFPKGTEIEPDRNIEFLNLLSFTEYLLSFEIIGNSENIVFQLVCSVNDRGRVESHLQAYFPIAIISSIKIDDFGFVYENDIAIADFGLNDEYMRSIATTDSFIIDPLTSVIATMESLQQDDIVVFQILFRGITSPLAKDITHSVSDGAGGSFFADAPEMPNCARDKVTNPLFSVVMRIATQGESNIRSQYLAQELARSITAISTSEYNKLIPLSNEGYDYDFHKYNLHHRLSNRLGFILNSRELNTFLHYPNATVISKKIGIQEGKTKQASQDLINQKYTLGTNEHNGNAIEITLNDEMKLRHTYIIGATGVGKSTLLANMFIGDIHAGNGCAIFDPHGDIVDDILLRIPDHRKNDVLLIDPSDDKYTVGFNLLGATTDAEKIVLSSDIVTAFKQHATAWGDTMTAVLSNAVNTFLESSKGGTIIELKRFLLEQSFREDFLSSVDDPSLHYYWNNEYAMVSKRIAPLLTRIDTFLRPKIIRYMMAQKTGVDFRQSIEEKKIVLIKLSQGLIGESNSFLLGSLFLSKFNQVALSRQSLSKQKRHPFYIYCDEFQNFITPSISKILSGARKYGLGLVLANQELAQIDEPKVLNSVISNPYTRICFRLGDADAKRLESGFSYFEESDLQGLGIGQAIMRVGSSQNDFNIATFPLPKAEINAEANKDIIVSNTRNKYAQPKEKLDELLISLLPKQDKTKKEKPLKEVIEKPLSIDEDVIVKTSQKTESTVPKEQQERYLKQAEEQEVLRKHRSLQSYIRTIAQQRGYRVHIEEELSDGKRVDVGLVKDDVRIALEVAVTNSNTYEAKNVQKCIEHGYHIVYVVSESETHLKNIKKEVNKLISTKARQQVFYINPQNLTTYLDIPTQEKKNTEPKRVNGWRIDVNYHPDDAKNISQNTIVDKVRKLLKKKK